MALGSRASHAWPARRAGGRGQRGTGAAAHRPGGPRGARLPSLRGRLAGARGRGPPRRAKAGARDPGARGPPRIGRVRMTLLPQAEWWRPQPAAAIGSAWPSAPVAASGTTGSRLAFRALLVFTFILVLAPQSFVPALQPFRIALVAAAVGIAAQLVERLAHGRPVTVMGRGMVLVAVLLAWSVVTVPWSLWPGGSVSFLLDAYFKTVAIFWLLANTVDTVDRLRTLAWSLTAMAVPLALTGLKNFMSGEFLGSNQILGYEAGLTANPNDLALMLNMLLPLGVALLLSSRGALARSVLVVVVLLEA